MTHWRWFRNRSPRAWALAGAALALVAIGLTAMAFMRILDPEGTSPSLWLEVAAYAVGSPLALGCLSIALFGIRQRIGPTLAIVGTASGLILFGFALLQNLTIVHGPRQLLLGVERGTIADLVQTRAAYVELDQARVDTTRLGTATHDTVDEEGRRRVYTSSAAPIITAQGEHDATRVATEPVVFFVCDDADDIRELAKAGGVVAGRSAPLRALDRQALHEYVARGTLVIAPAPRCVTPSYGDASTTALMWMIAFVLYVLVIAALGAVAVLHLTGRPAPTPSR